MSKELINEIIELKTKKNAVILAHNYELPEVQDLADFVGDSLGLSQQAAKTESDLIVFCGVHFMAETASIIAPDKKVIIPDLEAGCSLAASITKEDLLNWKSEFPEAVVVSYVNSTAEIKALSDYCVTSSNAVQVVKAIPENKKILFLPDQYLGSYTKKMTGRDIEVWKGACHVHEKIGELQFDKAEEQFPNAEFLVHPECGCSSSCMLKSLDCNYNNKIKILSTEGMVNYIKSSDSDEFVIATEVGILHRLNKFYPNKKFNPASDKSICEYMKMITVEKLYNSLLNDVYEVKVEKELAEKARLPIERMLSII